AEKPHFINGKYLLYSGSHLNYLGLAELEVEDDKITSLKNQLIPLEIPVKEFDTPLAKYIQEKTVKIEEEMSKVIGFIPEDWIPDKYQSTTLSRWIASALKTEYERTYHPDMAIINNGGLRKVIPAGPVTLRDLNELLPFNNTVVVFSCYGKDLLTFFQLNELHSQEKPFDICEYTRLDSIVSDKIYRIISHDYIAGQWDKYLGFKPFDIYDTGEPFLDAIIHQVQLQFSPINEKDWD
ncbi:MAG TPA: 5'-nucleotidase C-terminal domain-containing protein, partial [Candidatus Syntrophosphaera thermopropionivorans]|nr:5'-nucleotidase C-terminal domain-containing protein [Candidatus Syntrophosphaera thermopropionivorans]